MVPTLANPARAQSLRTSTKRAEVGDVLADDDAAGDVDVTPLHDPPRGAGAGGVAVQEQCDHHPGMEWRLTA
jgi:hypothetical protein